MKAAQKLSHLKRNYEAIQEANYIEPFKLNQVVNNVNYISKQLLADLQVNEESKVKTLN